MLYVYFDCLLYIELFGRPTIVQIDKALSKFPLALTRSMDETLCAMVDSAANITLLEKVSYLVVVECQSSNSFLTPTCS